MASNVMTGTAVLYSVPGTVTISGYATFILDSAKPTHKFDLDAVKEGGFDKSLIATNGMVEAEVVWTPSGATKAAAAVTGVFLSPLQSITLAGFTVTAMNGNWIYTGNEVIEMVQNGPGKMTLPIRKYDDGTQNTSLNTTVS